MDQLKFVFTGSGGQGVISSALLLAETASLREGLESVQSQSYGPEARGGATRGDVIIDDKPICYPKVARADILICMTQEAYHKYQSLVEPNGIFITDSDLVPSPTNSNDAHLYNLPLYRNMIENLKTAVGLNIALLGAVIKLTQVVKRQSLLETIHNRFPRFKENNEKAFDLGYNLV